jgi:hypothetical protein
MGKPTKAQRQKKAQKKAKKKAKTAKKDLSDMNNPLASMNRDASKARINDFIQRVSKPETLIDHIQRIGVQYWIAGSVAGQDGVHIIGEHLVIPWKELMDKEYEHIKAGGLIANAPKRRNPSSQPDFRSIGPALKKLTQAVQKASERRANSLDEGIELP